MSTQEPEWQISRQKAERFFVAVEATYRAKNSYHNSMHAADVVQAALLILRAAPNSVDFTKLEVFSLICAAAVHDLGHPGFTNDFLINTQHLNAIVYNDRSVNENFHVSSAFRIVSQDKGANIFSGLSRADYVQVGAACFALLSYPDPSSPMHLLGHPDACSRSLLLSGQCIRKHCCWFVGRASSAYSCACIPLCVPCHSQQNSD